MDGITLALRQQLFDKGMNNVSTLRKVNQRPNDDDWSRNSSFRPAFQVFRMEDWTGDGYLNRDEFEHAMHKCGIFLTASEISTVREPPRRHRSLQRGTATSEPSARFWVAVSGSLSRRSCPGDVRTELRVVWGGDAVLG